MIDPLVFEIQRLYPQIYLACHVEHVRAVSTKWRLSSHDASILAHLHLGTGISPKKLAAHLNVVPSTLSAAIERLVRLGYVKNIPKKEDKRRRELWLTEQGAEAMSAASVLDAVRVERLLEKLSDDERRAAITGLKLLARAARELTEPKEEEK